jgi:CRP/FNR family transcriptional regulator, dissimilatory nitrate respiration regulator
MVTAEWVKKAELFESLNESQLTDLLAHSAEIPCTAGQTIFNQGDPADYLYVLIQGTVELAVRAEEKIAIMTSKVEKEGMVFGIPSLLEPFRYNVSAKCLTPSRVLRFEANYIKHKIDHDPKMGIEIMRKLAFIYFNRLNELRAGIANFVKFLKLKTP